MREEIVTKRIQRAWKKRKLNQAKLKSEEKVRTENKEIASNTEIPFNDDNKNIPDNIPIEIEDKQSSKEIVVIEDNPLIEEMIKSNEENSKSLKNLSVFIEKVEDAKEPSEIYNQSIKEVVVNESPKEEIKKMDFDFNKPEEEKKNEGGEFEETPIKKTPSTNNHFFPRIDSCDPLEISNKNLHKNEDWTEPLNKLLTRNPKFLLKSNQHQLDKLYKKRRPSEIVDEKLEDPTKVKLNDDEIDEIKHIEMNSFQDNNSLKEEDSRQSDELEVADLDC